MTSRGIDPIVDGNAVLRPLRADDLPTTLEWRNHPDSRRWFLTTEPIEPEQHRQWFERYLEREDDHVFIVELDGRPAAQVALSDLARPRAEFGRLLVDPDQRGQGLAHRATELCLRAAREQLGLTEIVLEVKHDNAPAVRAYERAGFVETERHDGIVRMRIILQ